MTNLPAARWFMVVILFFLVAFLRPGTSAQFFPFAPNSPTEAKECESFRTAVEVYAAYYSGEHDRCLANNKPGHQQETKGSLICSRSRCQHLHDIVYGDSVFSAKHLEKEVASCYEAVRENQAGEAQRAPEATQKAQDESSSHVVNGKQEEAWEGAKEIFERFVDRATDNIEQTLNEEESELSPEDFEEFKHTADDAHAFLDGLGKTITVITFQEEEDSKKVIENPGDPSKYHDIIADSASFGFSYVLKRLSPDFLSPIYEGSAGWLTAITFDSSLTQMLRQHFDSMAALNNPGQYTFQQREAALQSVYQSAQNHPEVWNRARFQWLYAVSESLYNSSDNPNVHLTSPSSAANPNIILAPH
jgi:hypothetical protein